LEQAWMNIIMFLVYSLSWEFEPFGSTVVGTAYKRGMIAGTDIQEDALLLPWFEPDRPWSPTLTSSLDISGYLMRIWTLSKI
jgi:hypothetical protein